MSNNQVNVVEKRAKAGSGMSMLIFAVAICVIAIAVWLYGASSINRFMINVGIVGTTVAIVVSCFILCGLKVLKPSEALVLTLFGNYYGTLKGPGFYFVNPFTTAVYASTPDDVTSGIIAEKGSVHAGAKSRKISLKTMTLNNDKQKINDLLGNPIIIGVVVTWRIVDTAKAVFNVENYAEFLSIQCDSALRDTVRLYPYDATDSDNDVSLRGSSQEIAQSIRDELQVKVEIAGLEIIEARITNLAYAPEIAAAMLQRQQASAVVDARQMIVDGAVGMVEMALAKLSEKEIVNLDEERKAVMVSNLLVVLCGNKDAQPVVNSGSLY